MFAGLKPWKAGAGAILLAYLVVGTLVPPGFVRGVFGNIVPLCLIVLGAATMFATAQRNRGLARIFWLLMGSSFVLWFLNTVGWTWIEVVARKPLPEPFFGDTVLFIHIVPMMAAIGLRAHHPEGERKRYFSTLNFLMLLLWWVFLYMFIVFPDQYISLNVDAYGRKFDVLYLIQNLMLLTGLAYAYLSASGHWRTIYGHLLGASSLYTFSSYFLDIAIARREYHTGGVFDLPYALSICWFIWAGRLGGSLPLEPEISQSAGSRWLGIAPRLAMAAILSLPLMAFWALLLDHSPPIFRQFRILIALLAMLVLGFCVFLKQYRLDRDLMRLLQESRHSYQNLQRLQTQLVQKEKLASLGQLVAGAAHEINNPLAAILGYSDLLSGNSGLKPEQVSMAQKIAQQARRTRDLVADLLSFAQQTSGEKNSLEMMALLQRALKMHTVAAERRKISMDLIADGGLPPVWGNGNQLLQASLQIIENAIDALEEVGGGQLIVTLKREDDEIVIQFSDNGPGIRDPQRVFDPFYTTKPIGKGTGLGLSATYGVIQDHNGQITCQNKPDRGAVFTIRLPISAQPAETMSANA